MNAVLGLHRPAQSGHDLADAHAELTSVYGRGFEPSRCALERLLTEADYVVLALPLTNASHNLINAHTLSLMKGSAFLINIARGGVVDEKALIETLQTGGIAGAGLDVFCQEPLPSDSPLWALPNVLITPHTSPRERDRDERAVNLICENIQRYRSGERLLNEMSHDDVFTRY